MSCSLLDSFRLVGGTSLSLQLGHRISVDIDLFTDELYGTVDFDALEALLRKTFPYVGARSADAPIGMGTSYLVGPDKDNTVKVDFYYTDPFIRPPLIIGNLRLATLEEIAAMKLDIVQYGGRKKDFWDLDELLERYSISQLIEWNKQRSPYEHDEALIRANFTNFAKADNDIDPTCLRGKYWEIMKIDLARYLA